MTGPASDNDWQDVRAASQTAILSGLPDLLLPYQQLACQTIAANDVTFIEKSRRIGLTWGLASHAVLTAASGRPQGGMDVLYISYSMEMTREFIDACAMWAKAFNLAALDVSETLFEDPDSPEKSIRAFRINFGSGFEIMALSSAPRGLRGKQGLAIIDEAAFVDNLDELLKAAMAFLMWGGKVCVVSTHNGVEHPFNQKIQEIRAGENPAALIRITFSEALADGLHVRICLVTGKDWSQEAQDAWKASIRKHYGDDAEEELDCIPSRSGGVYLPTELLERATDRDIPVLRWSPPENGFVDLPDEKRQQLMAIWLEDRALPALRDLSPDDRYAWGVDFGRLRDRTVFWFLAIKSDLVRQTALVVELSDCPFTQQEQSLITLVKALPSWLYGNLDARGNGQYLAERARQTFGENRIGEVMLSEAWYLANMPPFKSAFQDGAFIIPADRDIVDDHKKIRVTKGIPKLVDPPKKGSDGKGRHGDAAIAAVLAYAASRTDGQEAAGETVEKDPVENEAQETTPGGVRRLLKRPGIARLFGGW